MVHGSDALAADPHQSDFTTEHYSLLLDLAKKSYRFVDHQEALRAADRFVVWRHDVDLSLNRALRFAQLEASKGISAIYFLNPHSEFYNLLEADQFRVVREIIGLGHRIGLHFDAKFYAVKSEAVLDELVAREGEWLRGWFDAEVAVFSFHNLSDPFLLTCEGELYGGLINCYSRRFKTDIGYCSDSNGYWRFRRLYDVLAAATDDRLQVLTHPGLWQEQSLPARSRAFRCAIGRAERMMSWYDATVEGSGRTNYRGLVGGLDVLERVAPDRFQLCDYLLNCGLADSLLFELFRIHGFQIRELCGSAHSVRVSTDDPRESQKAKKSTPAADFARTFGASIEQICGLPEDEHQIWCETAERIAHGSSAANDTLLLACSHFLRVIHCLAQWSHAHAKSAGSGSREAQPST